MQLLSSVGEDEAEVEVGEIHGEDHIGREGTHRCLHLPAYTGEFAEVLEDADDAHQCHLTVMDNRGDASGFSHLVPTHKGKRSLWILGPQRTDECGGVEVSRGFACD